MNARVQVHGTFTVSVPVPIFVVSVEILEGNVRAGMFLRVPLNSMIDLTARIASIGPINNSWGLPLVGLAIRCEDEGVREIIDAMNIGDEILAITQDGED